MDKSLPPIAIITGANSGIGVDFARELIQRGFPLLLTGRNEERLAETQKVLRQENQRPVETCSLDLCQANAPQQLLERALAMGTPSVLINNAGVGSVGNFLEQDSETIDEMVQTNVASLTQLCHLFGREMAEKGGGHILNHSSFSAIQPPSNYAVYAATKSYVLTLSQTLRQNLSDQKVFVTALASGFFNSEFTEQMGQATGFYVRWMTLNQKRVARAGIRGLFKGKTLVIPGLRYKCLNLLARCLPRSVVTGVANFALNRK